MNWHQLRTILWLRWRLTRNQWFRGGSVAGVIAIVAAVIGLCSSIGFFVGGLLAGAFAFQNAPTVVILITWDVITLVFLFAWAIGLLTELQRSETIDLQRLMHLPVALGQIFVINYLASHFSLIIIVAVPAMIGLGIGLAFGRGALFLLVVPLAVSMVFMVTAWTYYLRGWLATLMTNPRRRRTIIMCLTMGIVLLGQGPNLYFNVMRRTNRPPPNATPEERAKLRETERASLQKLADNLQAVQKYVPPLWLPVGAHAAAEGNALPALLGMCGCTTLGALGLRRAYRGTVLFYHGETGGKAPRIVRQPEPSGGSRASAPVRSRLIELQLAAIPEPSAAVAGATLRSMLRAPEVKMAWATSFIVTLLVVATSLFRVAPTFPAVAKPFVATGAVAFTLFMLFQFIANQFGLDRDGFRAFLLAPVDRRHLLLGKNLANIPIAGGFGVILIAAFAIWLHIPALSAIAAVFQLAAMILLMSMLGNLLSILIPYRIEPGSMKPTKLPALAMLIMFLCHMLFPLVVLPVFVPPLAGFLWNRMEWPEVVPVNLILSLALAALAVVAYWQSLAPLARLLHRRETEILRRVTAGTE